MHVFGLANIFQNGKWKLNFAIKTVHVLEKYYFNVYEFFEG